MPAVAGARDWCCHLAHARARGQGLLSRVTRVPWPVEKPPGAQDSELGCKRVTQSVCVALAG